MPLPPSLHALFPDRDPSGLDLDVPLPPGRVVVSTESQTPVPVLWVSDTAPPEGLWARLRAAHTRSGLWPGRATGTR